MKNVCSCTLVLEDSTFTDKESGKKIDYVAASVVVDGETLRVNFRKEDKSLLRVLRRDMPIAEE